MKIMSVEKLSSWLIGFNDTCPDPGLQAYYVLDESNKLPARIMIWIGMIIACEQITHTIVLALVSRRPIHFRVKFDPFELPIGLSMAWVIFTALSIFLVGFTFRSNAAVLTKSLHVLAETLFLVYISAAFGFTVFAGLACLLVFIILPMTFTLPCSETILLAASSGLILDAVNFLVYAWFGITQPNNSILWLYIGGLGWHALYLVTFVGVMRWGSLTDVTRAWFRIAGMYFNIVASELFLAAIRRRILVVTHGRQNLKKWLNEHDPELLTDPLCVWTGRGLRLLGPLAQDSTRSLYAFEPNRTAYTPKGCMQLANAIFPMFGQIKYKTMGDTTTVYHALACGFGWLKPYNVYNINMVEVEEAYVVSWMQIRILYWVPLLIGACVLGTYP